jgi:hypothetical protein
MALIGIAGKINSGKDTVANIIQYLTWKESIEQGSSTSLHYTLRDFTENKLGNMLSGWQTKAMADSLKISLAAILGCTIEQLNDRTFKETELPQEWWYWLETSSYDYSYRRISPYVEGENPPSFIHCTLVKPTPRLMLQLLGTECGRQILHPNIWVVSLFSHYRPMYKGIAFSAENSTASSGYHHLYCKSCNKGYVGYKRQYYCKECIEDNEIILYPNWIVTDIRFPNEKSAVENRNGFMIRVNRDYVLAGLPEDPKSQHKSETQLDRAEFKYTIENNGTIDELVEKVREILIAEKIIG